MEGLVCAAVVLPLGWSISGCAPGFAWSPPSSLTQFFQGKSLKLPPCSATALWDEGSEHPSTSQC